MPLKRTNGYKEYVLDKYHDLLRTHHNPNLKDLFTQLDEPWRALSVEEKNIYKAKATAINAKRRSNTHIMNRQNEDDHAPTHAHSNNSTISQHDKQEKENEARQGYIQEQLVARPGTGIWELMDEWDRLPDVVKSTYY